MTTDSMLCLEQEMPSGCFLMPMLDKIVIKCYPESDTYDKEGLIVKPDKYKDDAKPCIGKVVAVGVLCQHGEELLGHDVYFGSYAGGVFKVEGDVYKVLREEDIYCVKVPR